MNGAVLFGCGGALIAAALLAVGLAPRPEAEAPRPAGAAQCRIGAFLPETPEPAHCAKFAVTP